VSRWELGLSDIGTSNQTYPEWVELSQFGASNAALDLYGRIIFGDQDSP